MIPSSQDTSLNSRRPGLGWGGFRRSSDVEGFPEENFPRDLLERQTIWTIRQ